MSSSLPTEACSIVENPRRDIWDSFLSNNSLGNLWQTIDYSEFTKRLYPRTKTLRPAVQRKGVLEGIVQGVFSKYLGFGTDMTIQEGPVLSMTSSDKSCLLKSIISALEKSGVTIEV